MSRNLGQLVVSAVGDLGLDGKLTRRDIDALADRVRELLDDEEAGRCSACSSTGQVEYHFTEGLGLAGSIVTEPCPTCHGSGATT